MKTVYWLLAAVAVLVFVAACSPAGGQEPIAADPTEEPAEGTSTEAQTPMEENELQGVRWILLSYLNPQGQVVEALADREATVEFGADGQLGGNAGCNSYFASYTVDGDTLTISNAGSTMMACDPPEVMEQEAQFLAALGSAATWQIDGGQLVLRNAAGDVALTFAASEPASLTGVTWLAVNINNGNQAVVSLVADTTVTAVFSEDGKLNGSAGCNNFMSSYTLDGQNITIQPAATTRKMCPGEGVMEQETQFVNALASAATWRIDGQTLELRTADGALALMFTAEPVG